MDVALNESIDALRRADVESRTRSTEIAELRRQLGEAGAELAKAKEALRRGDHRVEALLGDIDQRQRSLDVFVKELTATKEALRMSKAESVRLKSTLDGLIRRSAAGGAGGGGPGPSVLGEADGDRTVLFLRRCLTTGCEPHSELLASLFAGGTLSVIQRKVTFAQLAALIDTLQATNATCDGSSFWNVRLNFEGDECFDLLESLLKALPGVQRITVDDASPYGCAVVANLAYIHSGIEVLQFAQPRFDDDSLSALTTTVHNRRIVAMNGGTAGVSGAEGGDAAKGLTVPSMDLSRSTIVDSGRLKTIGWESLTHLNLSHTGIDAVTLAAILSASPNITELCLMHCAGLTNDAVTIINQVAPKVENLDLRGCNALTQICFANVALLGVDVKATTVLDCPLLKQFTAPLQTVQCISWSTPSLETVTVHDASIDERQMKALAKCSLLRELSLVRCRLRGLAVLLGSLRRLQHFSAHASTGVTDDDLQLPSTLEALDLTDNFGLTDKCLAATAKCLQLRSLTVKRCANLTDGGLLLLQCHPALESLNVLGVKRVSAIALHRLCNSLPTLKELIHETVLLSTVTVERQDPEEAARQRLQMHAKEVESRRDGLALTYGAASPTRGTQ